MTPESLAEIKRWYPRHAGQESQRTIADLVAEVERLWKEKEWRPIAEAPKDGERVLIGWMSDQGNWQQRAAYWDAQFDYEYHEGRGSVPFGAWTDGAVASFGYEETYSYPATHFRLLPPPPTE